MKRGTRLVLAMLLITLAVVLGPVSTAGGLSRAGYAAAYVRAGSGAAAAMREGSAVARAISHRLASAKAATDTVDDLLTSDDATAQGESPEYADPVAYEPAGEGAVGATPEASPVEVPADDSAEADATDEPDAEPEPAADEPAERTIEAKVEREVAYTTNKQGKVVPTKNLADYRRMWSKLFGRSLDALTDEADFSDDDVRILVSGTMPEGVTAKATYLLFDESQAYSETAEMALDLALYDADGRPYTPEGDLTVTVGGSVVAEEISHDRPLLAYSYEANKDRAKDIRKSYAADVQVYRDGFGEDDRLAYEEDKYTDTVRFLEDGDGMTVYTDNTFELTTGEGRTRLLVAAQVNEQTLTAESGDTWVEVTGALSEDASANVEPVDAADYTDAVEGDQALTLDLSLSLPEEGEFEPDRPVDVTIADPAIAEAAARVAEAQSAGDESAALRLWHVRDDGTAEPVEGAAFDGDTVTFTADSFSVYVVTYTVDFRWGDYTYSIKGEGDILLSELLDALGVTEISIDDVESVSFSDPSLVRVEQVVGGQMSSSDFVLASEVGYEPVAGEPADGRPHVIVSTEAETADAVETEPEDDALSIWDVEMEDESDEAILALLSQQSLEDQLSSASNPDETLADRLAQASQPSAVPADRVVVTASGEPTVILTDEFLSWLSGVERDWLLISLAPFDTNETLALTLKSGEVVEIPVTDERVGTNPVSGGRVTTVDGVTYTLVNGVGNGVSTESAADGIPYDGRATVYSVTQDSTIHDELIVGGKLYKVWDVATKLTSSVLTKTKVKMDREFVNRASGYKFGLPEIKTDISPDEKDQLQAQGFVFGANNDTAENKLWKKATYNPETNSIEYEIKTFQSMKEDVPLDFIFIYDDSVTMYTGDRGAPVNNTANDRNETVIRETQGTRLLILSAAQALTSKSTEDGYNIRIALGGASSGDNRRSDWYSGTGAYSDVEYYLSQYATGGTSHSTGVNNALTLARESVKAKRQPIVIYLSDFVDGGGASTFRASATQLKAIADVYCLSTRNNRTEPRLTTIASSTTGNYIHTMSEISDGVKALENIILDAIGYYMKKPVTITDNLSDSLKDKKPVEINEGENGAGEGNHAFAKGKSTWTIGGNDPYPGAGTIYTETFKVQLDDSTVYAGSMPTNGTASIKVDGQEVNTLAPTTDPNAPLHLGNSVSFVMGRTDKNGNVVANAETGTPVNKVEGIKFTLRKQGESEIIKTTAVPDGLFTTDSNGVFTIDFKDADGNVIFTPGTYVLEEDASSVTEYNGIHSSVADPSLAMPDKSWLIKVDANGIITTSVDGVANQTPAMTVEKAGAGHGARYVVWNQIIVPATLIPLTVKKTWSGGSHRDPVPFTIYGVDPGNSENKYPLTAYDEQSTSSNQVKFIDPSNAHCATSTDANGNTIWTQTVYVPDKIDDDGGKKFYDYTSLTRTDLEGMPVHHWKDNDSNTDIDTILAAYGEDAPSGKILICNQTYSYEVTEGDLVFEDGWYVPEYLNSGDHGALIQDHYLGEWSEEEKGSEGWEAYSNTSNKFQFKLNASYFDYYGKDSADVDAFAADFGGLSKTGTGKNKHAYMTLAKYDDFITNIKAITLVVEDARLKKEFRLTINAKSGNNYTIAPNGYRYWIRGADVGVIYQNINAPKEWEQYTQSGNEKGVSNLTIKSIQVTSTNDHTYYMYGGDVKTTFTYGPDYTKKSSRQRTQIEGAGGYHYGSAIHDYYHRYNTPTSSSVEEYVIRKPIPSVEEGRLLLTSCHMGITNRWYENPLQAVDVEKVWKNSRTNGDLTGDYASLKKPITFSIQDSNGYELPIFTENEWTSARVRETTVDASTNWKKTVFVPTYDTSKYGQEGFPASASFKLDENSLIEKTSMTEKEDEYGDEMGTWSHKGEFSAGTGFGGGVVLTSPDTDPWSADAKAVPIVVKKVWSGGYRPAEEDTVSFAVYGGDIPLMVCSDPEGTDEVTSLTYGDPGCTNTTTWQRTLYVPSKQNGIDFVDFLGQENNSAAADVFAVGEHSGYSIKELSVKGNSVAYTGEIGVALTEEGDAWNVNNATDTASVAKQVKTPDVLQKQEIDFGDVSRYNRFTSNYALLDIDLYFNNMPTGHSLEYHVNGFEFDLTYNNGSNQAHLKVSIDDPILVVDRGSNWIYNIAIPREWLPAPYNITGYSNRDGAHGIAVTGVTVLKEGGEKSVVYPSTGTYAVTGIDITWQDSYESGSNNGHICYANKSTTVLKKLVPGTPKDVTANNQTLTMTNEKGEIIPTVFSMTNTFTPLNKVTLKSQFDDQSDDKNSTKLIENVTYHVTGTDSKGNSVDKNVVSKTPVSSGNVIHTAQRVLYLPDGQYTIEQVGYTIGGKTYDLMPYEVSSGAAQTQNITSDTEVNFNNIRKTLPVQVKMAWEPGLVDSEDPLQDNNKTLPYTIQYEDVSATNAPGNTDGTKWKTYNGVLTEARQENSHNQDPIPSYSVRGMQTECALSDDTLKNALPDYDLSVVPEETGDTLVFTIEAHIKRPGVIIEKVFDEEVNFNEYKGSVLTFQLRRLDRDGNPQNIYGTNTESVQMTITVPTDQEQLDNLTGEFLLNGEGVNGYYAGLDSETKKAYTDQDIINLPVLRETDKAAGVRYVISEAGVRKSGDDVPYFPGFTDLSGDQGNKLEQTNPAGQNKDSQYGDANMAKFVLNLGGINIGVTNANKPYICKINDLGVEVPFRTLNAAVTYARKNMDGEATIEMLVDYEIPSDDVVALGTNSVTIDDESITVTDEITLTTAETSGGDYNFVPTFTDAQGRGTSDGNKAIIKRATGNTASFFNVNAGSLTLNGVILDGGAVYDASGANTGRGALANGGLVSVGDGGTLALQTGTTLRKSATSGNGGAIYADSGATVAMTGGTVSGNSAAAGAGIYVASGATLELSGSPSFGGTDRNDDGSLKGTEGNFSTTALAEGSMNGGVDYTKARQDIFIAGTGEPLTSITLTRNLSVPEGSIWVWASHENHYEQLRQFAVYTGSDTITEATYKAFRNAQADGVSGCNGDYLTGEEGDSIDDTQCIYWTGVKGSRRVILRKVDSADKSISLSGAQFKIFTPSGKQVGDSYMSDDTGVFYVGNLDYNKNYYYVVETGAPSAASYSGNRNKVFKFKVTVDEPRMGGIVLEEASREETSKALGWAYPTP